MTLTLKEAIEITGNLIETLPGSLSDKERLKNKKKER